MARDVNGAKREAWHKRFERFDSSGLTVVDFCRREQVSQASFYYWSKRIRGGNRSTTDTLQRCEARRGTSRNEEGSDCVEVIVGDSIRVRMPAAQPAAVAALVHQLQKALAADTSATASRFQRIELIS